MVTGSQASFQIQAGPGIISLMGRISSQVTAELMDTYSRLDRTETVRLDFSHMDSLDVPGVNALIKLYLVARGQGRKLTATGLNPAFREVFIATRLHEAIPMEAPGPGAEGKVDLPPGWPWARPVEKLEVSFVPEGALNLNIHGLSTAGPNQGFGRLWEKTYEVRLPGINATPKEVIRVLKEKFPSFQPQQNRFYPTPSGIVPGEIVIINATTPGGLISTGVWVLYADDESFTFMTPEGHPEAGWVSFTAFEDNGAVTVRIQGFARAGDPVYEIGFVLLGSREQEKIWKHVLTSLARHFGLDNIVSMHKTCVADDYQWERWSNIRNNAQIRTTSHTLLRMIGL